MARHNLMLGLIACLSIGMLVGRTLSQTRGGFGGGSGFTRPRMGAGGSAGGRSGGRSSRVTDESREASWRGAVGATEQQWTLIKPKLERVKQLKREARMGLMTAGGGAGGSQSSGSYQSGVGFGGSGGTSRTRSGYRSRVRGGAGGSGFSRSMGAGPTDEMKQESNTWMQWNWYRSWGSKPAEKDDEKICEDLFSLLKSRSPSSQAIREKMDALVQAREQRRLELAEARKELRELLTLDQEARLLALGWLD